MPNTAARDAKYGKVEKGTSSLYKNATRQTPKMREVAKTTLLALGFEFPDSIVANHSAKKLQALVNFNLVCYYANLKLKWGSKQVRAFLEMLDKLNYTAVTLKAQWAFIKKLAEIVDFSITEWMEDHFDHVLAECKPIVDDKMLQDLLVQLIKVLECTFQEYNAALFQALLITAWGASMRISEYSFTRAHLPEHNVHKGTILPGKKGLSVEFYSDKVTKLHAAVKHRFVCSFYHLAQKIS